MKKAQVSTDTPIILFILVFQTFVILALGFLNITNTSVESPNITSYSEITTYSNSTTTVTTTNTGNSLFSIGNIISNIKILGWGNSLIFAPLIIVIIYIIAKLIRGGG